MQTMHRLCSRLCTSSVPWCVIKICSAMKESKKRVTTAKSNNIFKTNHQRQQGQDQMSLLKNKTKKLLLKKKQMNIREKKANNNSTMTSAVQLCVWCVCVCGWVCFPGMYACEIVSLDALLKWGTAAGGRPREGRGQQTLSPGQCQVWAVHVDPGPNTPETHPDNCATSLRGSSRAPGWDPSTRDQPTEGQGMINPHPAIAHSL